MVWLPFGSKKSRLAILDRKRGNRATLAQRRARLKAFLTGSYFWGSHGPVRPPAAALVRLREPVGGRGRGRGLLDGAENIAGWKEKERGGEIILLLLEIVAQTQSSS